MNAMTDVASDDRAAPAQGPTTGSIDAHTYDVIAAAVRHLIDHHPDQVSLDALAAAIGYSPFHLQRLFGRWVGISPKRFVQYLTVEHAKMRLRQSSSVLDAAYDAGLSGSGRLHDLFVACEAMTPGDYKAAGAGLEIATGWSDTPFGPAYLGVTARGVCFLGFTGGSQDPVEALRRQWSQARLIDDGAAVAAMAARIFGGDAGPDRPLPVLLKGTNFQIKVWQALLRIPEGRLASYQDVALAAGVNPRAVRAVGSAVGINPIAYLIPCHRVIRGSGIIDSYRWGGTRKRAMIAWEAARTAA